jgi:hypothetical protein
MGHSDNGVRPVSGSQARGVEAEQSVPTSAMLKAVLRASSPAIPALRLAYWVRAAASSAVP